MEFGRQSPQKAYTGNYHSFGAYESQQRQQSPQPQPQYLAASSPVPLVRQDTSRFSKSTLEKAATAKLKIEHFYKMAVEQAVERNQRFVWAACWAAELT